MPKTKPALQSPPFEFPYKLSYDHVIDGKTSQTFATLKELQKAQKKLRARYPYVQFSAFAPPPPPTYAQPKPKKPTASKPPASKPAPTKPTVSAQKKTRFLAKKLGVTRSGVRVFLQDAGFHISQENADRLINLIGIDPDGSAATYTSFTTRLAKVQKFAKFSKRKRIDATLLKQYELIK